MWKELNMNALGLADPAGEGILYITGNTFPVKMNKITVQYETQANAVQKTRVDFHLTLLTKLHPLLHTQTVTS